MQWCPGEGKQLSGKRVTDLQTVHGTAQYQDTGLAGRQRGEEEVET